MHEHAQVYLANEERLTARLFPVVADPQGMKTRMIRRMLRRCAFQLNPHSTYLPEFPIMLEKSSFEIRDHEVKSSGTNQTGSRSSAN
jgi:hypothetical protein